MVDCEFVRNLSHSLGHNRRKKCQFIGNVWWAHHLENQVDELKFDISTTVSKPID